MNGIERAIRESGQHPGHTCPVCGNPLEKEVIVTEELVIVDGVVIPLPPRLMKGFRWLYDNYGRPVNRALFGSSPVQVRVYLHELRRALLHTRLAIRDVDGGKESVALHLRERS